MSIAIKELLSAEEIAALTARSDMRGALALLRVWGAIAAILAVLIAFPNPLTFVLAVLLLGGQQLACAVLAHEAAHRSLFRSRWCNDVLTDWLCARPIWFDVERYRAHHMYHHRHTGVEGDPDVSLVDPFPCSAKSMRRKLARDLFGISGLRRMIGLLGMDLGILRYTVAAEVERLPRNGRRWHDYALTGVRNLTPLVLTNLLLAALLMAFDAGWAYAAWLLAWLAPFSLYLRIRSIAEHACTERSEDYLKNTRTTRANWLARLTVAPMNVNYHIEHHLMASVPYWRLPDLNRLLAARHDMQLAPGYGSVLRLACAAGDR